MSTFENSLFLVKKLGTFVLAPRLPLNPFKTDTLILPIAPWNISSKRYVFKGEALGVLSSVGAAWGNDGFRE